jgi:hypothetical protein
MYAGAKQVLNSWPQHDDPDLETASLDAHAGRSSTPQALTKPPERDDVPQISKTLIPAIITPSSVVDAVCASPFKCADTTHTGTQMPSLSLCSVVKPNIRSQR